MTFRAIVRHVTGVIDTLVLWTGKLVAWFAVVLMFAIVYHVFMRYVFNAPTVWAYDVTYML